jgi:hypothetical protein
MFSSETQAQGVYMQTGTLPNMMLKKAILVQAISYNLVAETSMNYIVNMKTEKLKYMLGLGLNEYNAIGGNAVSSYSEYPI